MNELLAHKPENQNNEPKLDRQLVVGRLRELGIKEDLEYLFDEHEFDDNVLLGEIVTLALMYDLDMDDVLPEVAPIEKRTRGEEGEPYSDEI